MSDLPNSRRKLKAKLRNGESTFGVWVTLESPAVSEIAAHLDLDWICIDTEHGALGFQNVEDHLRAIARSSTVGLVRVQAIDASLIQRVLGLGADGIIVPRVRTAEDVERSVSFAKYPPRGSRGMGAERSTSWGRRIAYAKTANQDTMVIPLIETMDAARDLEAILRVPDVDAFFFGPADFSASAGQPGEWEGEGIAEELLRIKEQIRAAGHACGIIATGISDGKARIAQGFRMIGLGVECALLIRSITEMKDALCGSASDTQ
jgi:2-keto-3-deoxy-L-rhamnonate aldolase RhmA